MQGRNIVDFTRILISGLLMILAANVTMATQPGADKPEFEFLRQTIDQDFVTLDYKLPFDGVVELRIFSAEGNLVWKNQYLNDRGENRIRLKTAAFENGNAYSIQLNYKTETYRLQLDMK